MAVFMPLEGKPYEVPHLKALISGQKFWGGQRCSKMAISHFWAFWPPLEPKKTQRLDYFPSPCFIGYIKLDFMKQNTDFQKGISQA